MWLEVDYWRMGRDIRYWPADVSIGSNDFESTRYCSRACHQQYRRYLPGQPLRWHERYQPFGLRPVAGEDSRQSRSWLSHNIGLASCSRWRMVDGCIDAHRMTTTSIGHDLCGHD